MLSLAGLEDMQLKGFIVRKEAKGHGTKAQVEGPLNGDEEVVIIEDVVTTGGSSMKAIKALELAGCKVKRVLAVVDREEGGRDNLAAEGYQLESIFTARELLEYE
jgi:orotate phosphoribosyltransferase